MAKSAIERFPHRRFQLSKFCIYGHKISQGYSIMTDNLKRAGIFRKSVYFFFTVWPVLDFYMSHPQHVICLQTVLKLARWQVVAETGAEIGFCGTWDLLRRKRSIGNTALVFVYEIRLWKTDFAFI